MRDATYRRYARAIEGRQLPVALIDLDALDRNIERLLSPVRQRGKTLRIASKSIRCPELISYIGDQGRAAVRGIMSYAASEAAFLVELGFGDIVLAYPTVQESDTKTVAKLNADGATVSIVVDCVEHLQPLSSAATAAGCQIPVVLEVDLSFRLLGGVVHLGARRSPLYTSDGVLAFAEEVARFPNLRLHGIMGYEAQIAGSTDQNPFTPLMNIPKRLVKDFSRRPVEEMRRKIMEGLKNRRISISIFNGGGTGSLAWCTTENALTEVTAGSGFLDSHLFDYYRDLDVEPAAFFALQVVRRPTQGMVTCHGGGYVASGQAGKDRLPVPFLPKGLELIGFEGAGEVQTPVRVPPRVDLEPGDPVFFRHAKAGELAEHFNEYLCVRGDQIEKRSMTYRGLGKCFL